VARWFPSRPKYSAFCRVHLPTIFVHQECTEGLGSWDMLDQKRQGRINAVKISPHLLWLWFVRKRRLRDRAMFDLAINCKLRGRDVVKWLKEPVESRIVGDKD